MNQTEFFDIVVLGAGPAGLAAAIAAADTAKVAGSTLRVLVIEREEREGGILKQCIHDGFGLVRFKEKLTGPEYARRDIDAFAERGIELWCDTFVSKAERAGTGYELHCITTGGVRSLLCGALVLATGCRERTDRQVFIHGDRPAGIYTAGLAQALVNLHGLRPGKRAVILGSGDIGLIMARRLTLEGVEVAGVYEVKPEVSGLSRNVQQCVLDFDIPLELSTTVTRVFGERRVEAVELCKVDEKMRPLPETAFRIECDTLVLSVGLIPENELAQLLEVPLDNKTRGPLVDQNMQTMRPGIFACGNAVHVNDLVDYVSESAETAGRAAANFIFHGRTTGSVSHTEDRRPNLVPLAAEGAFLYTVPQYLDVSSAVDAIIYFRSASTMEHGARLSLLGGPDKAEIEKRNYSVLRPPEMERLVLKAAALTENKSDFCLALTEVTD